MCRRLVVLFVVSALAGVAAPPTAVFAADPDGGPALAWDKQFGTARRDIGRAVAAAPDGTVVVAGSTWGTLADTSAIGEDAFVRTYSAAGEVGWTHQFGTSNGDGVPGVAVAPSGRIFVAGYTGAALAGQTSSGYSDGFVRAYDADGTALDAAIRVRVRG